MDRKSFLSAFAENHARGAYNVDVVYYFNNFRRTSSLIPGLSRRIDSPRRKAIKKSTAVMIIQENFSSFYTSHNHMLQQPLLV